MYVTSNGKQVSDGKCYTVTAAVAAEAADIISDFDSSLSYFGPVFSFASLIWLLVMYFKINS